MTTWPTGPTTKLFRITEPDLIEMETLLPEVAEALSFGQKMDNAMRTKIRRMRTILQDVRWETALPSKVEVAPDDIGERPAFGLGEEESAT